MKTHAFLSHSISDQRLVSDFAILLDRAFGHSLDTFVGTKQPPGSNFEAVIREQLMKCQVFILFASRHSLKRDWVKREVAVAWSRATSILQIPIFIGDVKPDQLPDSLRGIQGVCINTKTIKAVIDRISEFLQLPIVDPHVERDCCAFSRKYGRKDSRPKSDSKICSAR